MSLPYPVKAFIGIGLAILLMLLVLRPDDEWPARRLLDFTLDSCRNWATDAAPAALSGVGPAEISAIEFRGNRIGERHRLALDAGGVLIFEAIAPGGRASRFVTSLFDPGEQPRLLLALDRDCQVQVVRRIDYSGDGQALAISTLDEHFEPRGEAEWLNPPLESPAGQPGPDQTGSIPVGMVDSGVNYLLPDINLRLARDDDGRILGYDFWDLDGLPFDAHPVDSGFFVQRHGTRTASLLLREAPMAALVPYRYPRPDMTRMQAVIERAAADGVAILGMPLGGIQADVWIAFEQAARAHPELLFVVSAGNDGRDIDDEPVYPAALQLDNMIVVTSADDFVRPAERTNWGRRSVDFMVPAENVDAVDFSGEPIRVAGSSYAVSRVTALAARIKASRPASGALEIIEEIRRNWTYSDERTRRWVASGYIADPLSGGEILRRPLAAYPAEASTESDELPLSLKVLVLDPAWAESRLAGIVEQAYDILAQCKISRGSVTIDAVEGAEYLRDLATGSARTLLDALGGEGLTVVMARDTRMLEAYTGEAFGLGNTRMRPWLANSVWLMLDVDDPGIALAHEAYHVVANSGAHIEGVPNLMQARTHPDSTDLTPQQCRLARENGIENGLLVATNP